MNEVKHESWLKEFNDFLQNEQKVPGVASDQVFRRISGFLNPSVFLIFSKVLGIHLVVGTLSLTICHQFGFNPFGTEKSLADWFMSVGGHGFCMIGCGVLFSALSILAAGYFLTIEEVRVLRRTEFLQALCLSLFSLGAFAFFGAHLALTFGGLWLLGSLVGGFAATEALWLIKKVSV